MGKKLLVTRWLPIYSCSYNTPLHMHKFDYDSLECVTS